MKRVVTLQQLVRRAELYGTELLWETVERNLDVDIEDRGRLALHLRRIDPAWKLSKRTSPRVLVSQRDRLIFGLIDAGWTDKRIRAAAGVGATTFRALKAQYLRDANAQKSGDGHITPTPPETSVQDVLSWGGNDPPRIVDLAERSANLADDVDGAAERVALGWLIAGADILVAGAVAA